jgi:hypothetical protein
VLNLRFTVFTTRQGKQEMLVWLIAAVASYQKVPSAVISKFVRGEAASILGGVGIIVSATDGHSP